MTHVLVLHASLRPGPGDVALDELLRRLPYAKRQELERRSAAERLASLAGIGLALHGLGDLSGHGVDAGQLRFPDGGKPYLTDGTCFSVTHAAGTVAVAVTRDCELGFDLEETARPGAATADGDAAEMERLLRWTATEAVLKAAGQGLREARSVELDTQLSSGRVGAGVFQLTLVAIPGAVAHLATSVPVTSLVVKDCPLSVALRTR